MIIGNDEMANTITHVKQKHWLVVCERRPAARARDRIQLILYTRSDEPPVFLPSGCSTSNSSSCAVLLPATIFSTGSAMHPICRKCRPGLEPHYVLVSRIDASKVKGAM